MLALRDSSELFQKQNWKGVISSAHECASEVGKLCYHHRFAHHSLQVTHVPMWNILSQVTFPSLHARFTLASSGQLITRWNCIISEIVELKWSNIDRGRFQKALAKSVGVCERWESAFARCGNHEKIKSVRIFNNMLTNLLLLFNN